MQAFKVILFLLLWPASPLTSILCLKIENFYKISVSVMRLDLCMIDIISLVRSTLLTLLG
jgi:hypothetical protein